MTRALSVPVRLIAVLALAVLLPSLGASLAGAQPSAPALDPINGLLSPGQTVSVTGAGWAPGEFVSVQVCGNDGVNGSSDCDVASGASFPILTGELRTPIVVTIPPRPCPCVILAVGALTEAKTPISIAGTTSAPVSSDSPLVNPDIGPTLRVDRAVVEDDAGWPSWFGAPAERTLVLTVTNTGATAVPQPFMSVAYGKGDDPRTVIDAPRVPPIEAGQTAVVRVPFELDAFSYGTYRVVGDLGVVGNRVEFESTTSTWPWGLVLVAIALIQMMLVAFRNIARRRLARQRRAAEAAEAAAMAGGTPDSAGPESRVDDTSPSPSNRTPDPVGAAGPNVS